VQDVKRTLNLIAGSFAIAGIAIAAVLSAIDLGEPTSPDLADGGALASAIFGAIGFLIALQWWSRAGEISRTAARVQMGFIVRVAVAETGALLGILTLMMTGSNTALLIGLALFLVSLLLLTLGLSRISE